LSASETVVAIAGLCVFYAYAGYPLLIAGLARWRENPSLPGRAPESFSVVLAAYDEAGLEQRIDDLMRSISEASIPAELIVVLDGPSRVDPSARAGLRLIRLPKRRGKAFAMSVGSAAARNEILVFADARQTWERGALAWLLNAFCDARVGAVSGEVLLAEGDGAAGAVGLYWRYEKWIRRIESQFNSTVGVTGSISAARRSLFEALPEGLVLDDVHWPMKICMRGHRAVFEPRARALDRLPQSARDEFRRKVRTLSGNFQLVQFLPALLIPWRNPLFWQFVSHKLTRLLVPWALLAMFVISAMGNTSLMHLFLGLQCAGYGLALAGLTRVGRGCRPAAIAGAFLLLNAAAWVAFWVWISGRASRSWVRVNFMNAPSAPPTAA
jgi:biofilm PGA synthesis N-glycosyltransferase PgaC